MIFALIGNQNCGKTTLFNQLTGANQRVGNFPGVTVDGKSGVIKEAKDCTVVDLPGIYSLRPYSGEEVVTRDFLLNGKPDAVINIVDATNIERNLYLTLQVLEFRIPTVVALNMMDEVTAGGGSIDTQALSERLGVPVLPISAVKNEGVSDLVRVLKETAKKKVLPAVYDFCGPGPIHRCIHSVAHIVEDHAEAAGLNSRFAAIKAIEEDEDVVKLLNLDKNELETVEHSVVEMETEHGMDRHAAMADMRYTFIEKACEGAVVKAKESKEYVRSRKMDKVLTNRYAAIPIFFGVMALIFYLTFEVVGYYLSELIALGIDKLCELTQSGLESFQTNPVMISLITDGIFKGVGSVLSFIPYVVVLFFFFSLLEDTGYMARVAFVMDKPLRKIGLSGRSIVPMLIGFGCSVPAVMSARTMTGKRDRIMTTMLIPFMSCSAKIPIYALFTAAFFPKYKALVMMALYVGGIVVGILLSLLLKVTAFRGKPNPFMMELPNYRFPSPKSTLLLMWEKAKDFIVKAFTIIFFASLIIWFLQTFDIRFNPVTGESEKSMLAAIGGFIAPVFKLCGFDSWQASTALIAGFTAKEAVVSTLGVLTGDPASLFSAGSAISFMVFTLLYTPCVAAVTTIRKETKSLPFTLMIVALQCVLAWIFSTVVYQIIAACGG
ncbi:MAG: ferrous iron transport protein B [Clostridia bacterium]|nr:ferrous iron transport protein B [Clostridia bacterium]